MWRLDKRTFCGASLILILASGCCAERGMRAVGQCGQGHDSLLDCVASKFDSRCDDAACDDGCHQRPVPASPRTTTPVAPPVPTIEPPAGESPRPTPPPPPPSETVTRAGQAPALQLQPVSPGRRMLNRLPAAMRSIPLPRNWFGGRETAATTSESDGMQDIPWNAPVAAADKDAKLNPETTQVVGYEYGQPVELQAPDFNHSSAAGSPLAVPPATDAARHSVFSNR